MLKTIPSTTHCGCGYFKSKCAEIHYQASSFSIVCIFCGITTLDYTAFLEHFHAHHFEDFSKTQQIEPIVSTAILGINTSKSSASHNDPLEFGERELTEDPNEVMKKLQDSQYEVKQLKTEEANIAADKALNEQSTLNNDFNESDEEFLVCKIKVEPTDLKATSANKMCKTRKRLSNIKLESTRNENKHEEKCTNNENVVTKSNDEAQEHKNEFDEDQEKEEQREKEIDWTKPYAPNLLKNHEKRPYKPRNKPNICTYCGRTFRRRYQLDTHLNIHTGLKPHQCEICGRQFRAVTTLTRHLTTHEQRESYTCKYCLKPFTHKAALLSHESRHTQERSVPCDECDKYFYTANQLDTHKRKVHHKADDDALRFACDLCTKRYRSASMLSTHKFKKHYKTAKIICEQCGKKFINGQQLEAHKQIHVDKLAAGDTPSQTTILSIE